MSGGHIFRAAVAGLLGAVISFGQSFEAASVKVSDPKLSGRIIPPSGGPGTSDPNHVTFTNAILRNVLAGAYDVHTYQIEGPAWLDSERYTIEAVLPVGTSEETYRLMLQNLLTERFHLVTHRDFRVFRGYELVVGKNGSKLKESQESLGTADSQEPSVGHAVVVSDNKGQATLDRPDLVLSLGFAQGGGIAGQIIARDRPISALVERLIAIVHQPVLDGTDLPGRYDFKVEYDASPNGSGSAADVFTALQEQCGLKLEARKMSIPMIVVDRGDKIPAEN